jgi:hypothetical protein
LVDATISHGAALPGAGPRCIGSNGIAAEAPLANSARGVAAMRVNIRLRQRCVKWLTRSAYTILALVGAVPYAVAGDLIQTVPGLWIPATALSLTLVTAVVKSQK